MIWEESITDFLIPKISKVVITGDLTQIDLPKDTSSGLIHALEVLSDVDDAGLVRFSSKDVLRHTLVQKIIEAYERFKGKWKAL